jgi:hypothetical protein
MCPTNGLLVDKFDGSVGAGLIVQSSANALQLLVLLNPRHTPPSSPIRLQYPILRHSRISPERT